MKLRKVIFCGSRYWNNEQIALEKLKEQVAIAKERGQELLVIHGGCYGLDMLVDYLCIEHGIHRAKINALWISKGKAAGPIRNSVMVALAPDFGLCFHPDIAKSKGTKDCALQMGAAGIDYEVIR